jgi:hypothetical protein
MLPSVVLAAAALVARLPALAVGSDAEPVRPGVVPQPEARGRAAAPDSIGGTEEPARSCWGRAATANGDAQRRVTARGGSGRSRGSPATPRALRVGQRQRPADPDESAAEERRTRPSRSGSRPRPRPRLSGRPQRTSQRPCLPIPRRRSGGDSRPRFSVSGPAAASSRDAMGGSTRTDRSALDQRTGRRRSRSRRAISALGKAAGTEGTGRRRCPAQRPGPGHG